jgi:hypothetical protein
MGLREEGAARQPSSASGRKAAIRWATRFVLRPTRRRVLLQSDASSTGVPKDLCFGASRKKTRRAAIKKEQNKEKWKGQL